MDKKVTMLVIIDGYGKNPESEGNAVAQADKPNLDKLMATCPNSNISASGGSVGLPDGQMGNSEVGHTNIGAGRIVYQDLTRITKSIEEGDFFSIPEFTDALDNVKQNGKKLHILGLVSDGGVHSHQRHLYGLLELCKRKGLEGNVFIHALLDGRDTLPASGEGYVQALEEVMKEKGVGKIATVGGRFYGMDRDKRWQREQKAYDAMVFGKGETATSATSAIESSYQKEVFDEFVVPTVIMNGDKPVATIDDGDSVIFFNFRPDRARQITRALVDPEFKEFETKPMHLNFVTMTEYDETIPNVKVAFKPEHLNNTFGEIVSKRGMTQLRIAETEKYAHVTFFFNGGREEPYEGEDRILIPSPKVETYDLKPEMSANEITDKVVEAINARKYDAIILNFANSDMVGHTGNIPAAIKAVETVDNCVGRIAEAIKNNDGTLLITADHGNSEQMLDYKTGEPFTSHTTNLVPFIVYNKDDVKVKDGRLCDIAPTMLDLMGIEQPVEMTGESLIIRE